MKPTDRMVKLADGTLVPAEGIGHSLFHASINGVLASKQTVFPNVLYVPSLSNNLISTGALVESEGYTQEYDRKGMRFFKDGVLQFTATVGDMRVPVLDGNLPFRPMRMLWLQRPHRRRLRFGTIALATAATMLWRSSICRSLIELCQGPVFHASTENSLALPAPNSLDVLLALSNAYSRTFMGQ